MSKLENGSSSVTPMDQAMLSQMYLLLDLGQLCYLKANSKRPNGVTLKLNISTDRYSDAYLAALSSELWPVNSSSSRPNFSSRTRRKSSTKPLSALTSGTG